MNEKSIREGLLEMEKRTPEFEEKFRKEIKRMMEKTLTRTQKIGYCFAIFLGLAMAILFSYAAVTAPPEFSVLGRMIFVSGVLFALAWIGLGIWTLKRKSFNWLRQENVTQGLTFGFILFLLIVLMMLGSQLEDKVIGMQMMLQGAIFFMVFGIPALFNLRINRTETALREHLLKLELKVAELTDLIQQAK
jgi:hypothetical protein